MRLTNSISKAASHDQNNASKLHVELSNVCAEQLSLPTMQSVLPLENQPKQSYKLKEKASSFSKIGFSNKGATIHTASKARWICNVSEHVKLAKGVERAINISGKGKFSQYELMVKLLKAETCDVIYFDCQLSAQQIGILKMLQVFSKTELKNARLAMQFSKAAS
uniref:hypothetical protein n=1 Tax=Ningiella ruwaisensis TaxID=2364274 RepID=UPI00109F6CBE|nr:hypothetical protein [Ningiella ruwaisensis]